MSASDEIDGHRYRNTLALPVKEALPVILEELYKLTASLGGRISGEHGIGHKRKKYMPLFVSAEYLDMLRAIKKAMDPNLVLNPGKIFDV